MTLDELWPIARQYGKVGIHTMKHGYWCKIEFNTVDGIELTADSSSQHITPHKAMIEAIKKAELIVASFAKSQPRKLLEGGK